MSPEDARQEKYERATLLIDLSQTHRRNALEAAMAVDPESARDEWHKHRDADKEAHALMHELMES